MTQEKTFLPLENACRALANSFLRLENAFGTIENRFLRLENALRALEKTFLRSGKDFLTLEESFRGLEKVSFLFVWNYNFIHPSCCESRAITFIIFAFIQVFFTICKAAMIFVKFDSAIFFCV